MGTTTRDLLTGIAQMINDSSIATYRPTGTYLPTETAIVFKSCPPSPDRMIMLTYIPLTDAAMEPTGKGMLQIYFRGRGNDPMDVEDLGDAVFDLLQGATYLPFGSAGVVQILRQGSVGNGQDASKRWTRIDRYFIDLDVPPTPNRPFGGWD